jgi:hypothetical protein
MQRASSSWVTPGRVAPRVRRQDDQRAVGTHVARLGEQRVAEALALGVRDHEHLLAVTDRKAAVEHRLDRLVEV